MALSPRETLNDASCTIHEHAITVPAVMARMKIIAHFADASRLRAPITGARSNADAPRAMMISGNNRTQSLQVIEPPPRAGAAASQRCTASVVCRSRLDRPDE